MSGEQITFEQYLTQWLIEQGTSPPIARFGARKAALDRGSEVDRDETHTYAEWDKR